MRTLSGFATSTKPTFLASVTTARSSRCSTGSLFISFLGAFEYTEGVPALRGVTMNIKRGEFVMIIGKSGSGKTTMLNILGGRCWAQLYLVPVELAMY